ncbi:hypothetical protein JSE7799_01797 [Jannaschia seosinensis]|uniref:Uncharacterized protein n=1 Tax=Jannaschia seosinensis TaxID=313367 RepID=A0A0M7B8H0_9RHOB|nr:hypothetical protein [Jannaschia seosinensis]CUH39077.1 hypothetical protein JSE7799_01797 [Jannaschia seosinensis]
MTRALADRICSELPGAKTGDRRAPGRRDWTIGGAVFASLGDDAMALRATDDSSRHTGQTPGADLPGGGAGWEETTYGATERELRDRIALSYDHARRALPGDADDRLPVWTLPG